MFRGGIKINQNEESTKMGRFVRDYYTIFAVWIEFGVRRRRERQMNARLN